MKKTLSQILIDSSLEALHKQHTDGSMPAGNNGPYNYPETHLLGIHVTG